MFQAWGFIEAAVRAYARQSGRVLVAENHSRVGGLYSAVCEALSMEEGVRIARVAVEDAFGEVGPQPYLQERFGLTCACIVRQMEGLFR